VGVVYYGGGETHLGVYHAVLSGDVALESAADGFYSGGWAVGMCEVGAEVLWAGKRTCGCFEQ